MAGSTASGSESNPAGASRSRIPPPRRFSQEELQGRKPDERRGRVTIPPPRQFVISPDAGQPASAPVPSREAPREADAIPQARRDLPPNGGNDDDASGMSGTGSKSDRASTPLLAPDAAPTPPSSPAAPEDRPTDLSQTLRGSEVPLQDAPTAGPGSMERPVDAPEPAAAASREAKTEQPSGEMAEPARLVKDSPAIEPTAPPVAGPSATETSAPTDRPEPGPGPMPSGVKEALETLSQVPAARPATASDPAPIQEPQAAEVPSTEARAPVPAPETQSVPAPATPVPPPQAQEPATGSSPVGSPAGPVPVPASRESALVAGNPPQETTSNPNQAAGPEKKAEPSLANALGQLPDRIRDAGVERTACATCGGFHSSLDGPALHGCLTCGGGPNCVPGQKPCHPPANECNTTIGAFCQSLYECLCCPDPCYQPSWVPAANASFFADYARPRTVTRIRYDNLEAMTRPDRNQFWMNQVVLLRSNPNRRFVDPRARLQQVYLYQEAAGERGSFFVEYPYRQLNSNWEPTQAGFGDVNFGLKSLLFDCEMLQVTFQMRTYMPSGNFSNNLGTGQFVVDPSILTSLKLSNTTYFQGQFGNWTPVGGPGGNSKLAGGVFYWLMSLNQVLWYATPDSPLIATLEMDGWSFENGGYTKYIPRGQTMGKGPGTGLVPDGGGVSYFNIGPGLRQSVCNRLDFGGAITWATNTAHWAQPWFRFEVRFLF